MALVSVPASARKVRTALLALAAVGALLGTAAGTAQAAPRQTPPGNWVHVAVMQGDSAVGAVNDTLLRCSPRAAGSHPHAARACAELALAKGSIAEIRAVETSCPMIYKPVTAFAYGMWNGRRVAYARNFANECAMTASTGSLFAIS
ncbi:SSI family serine proteinase inhibitor [Streptomyces sp. NPDC102467]|uniref:SSI family serine proteinase inhibitor n=1 Tax=Streptomyces sp. NPDC102467 TaxID=3366179 RepID=UPI0037F63A5E